MKIPSPEIADLLQAASVVGLGARRYDSLIERFGSWGEAVKAPLEALASVPGISVGLAQKVKAAPSSFDPEKELLRAAELGVSIVHRGSASYPSGLRLLPDAPLVLYVKGEIRENDALALAVVGSRRCTFYGRAQAERLAAGLASAGFTVVSGMAEGIDSAAHRGALKVKGRTIAVLGCGLANLYPPGSEELAREIVASGALISELPLDTTPKRWYFPQRNRLIAALSLGVVVAEAALRSGALITARLAAEMGKEVFAVPGDVARPETRGCHQLLRDGAHLVEQVADIIAELGPLAELVETPKGEFVQDPRALSLNPRERTIFQLLSSIPRTLDEIIMDAGLSPAQVMSTLMVLEVKKLARRLAGARFVRT